MTSSDATALPPGAVESAAARVGTSLSPQPARGGRVGVACATFNGGITTRLLDGALAALDEHGPGAAGATVVWVPGAFELPLAAQHLARAGTVDAVVALGAVIRGDTAHFDFVAGECARGLARVALDEALPVVFGVLTTDTVDQALERCGPGPANKGYEAGLTALEMVGVGHRLLVPVAASRPGGDAARAVSDGAGPLRRRGA